MLTLQIERYYTLSWSRKKSSKKEASHSGFAIKPNKVGISSKCQDKQRLGSSTKKMVQAKYPFLNYIRLMAQKAIYHYQMAQISCFHFEQTNECINVAFVD